MPNQRSAENVQTSISLPNVLLKFAQKKAETTGLENVSAYLRFLVKRDQLEHGEDLVLVKPKKKTARAA